MQQAPCHAGERGEPVVGRGGGSDLGWAKESKLTSASERLRLEELCLGQGHELRHLDFVATDIERECRDNKKVRKDSNKVTYE